MYTHNQDQIQSFLPFGGNLNPDNRWVKLAGLIPWKEFESTYSKSLKGSGFGPPAKSVRAAFGALIIKERLGTSDEETVEQVRENPYLQYFLGFKEYMDKAPFHSTMFVHLRKRITKDMIGGINEAVARKAKPVKQKITDNNDDPESGGSS